MQMLATPPVVSVPMTPVTRVELQRAVLKVSVIIRHCCGWCPSLVGLGTCVITFAHFSGTKTFGTSWANAQHPRATPKKLSLGEKLTTDT